MPTPSVASTLKREVEPVVARRLDVARLRRPPARARAAGEGAELAIV